MTSQPNRMAPTLARSSGLGTAFAAAVLLASTATAGLRGWFGSDMMAAYGVRPAVPVYPTAKPVARRKVGHRLVVRYHSSGHSAAEAQSNLRRGAYRELVRELVQPVDKLRAEVDRLSALMASQRPVQVKTASVSKGSGGQFEVEGEVEIDPDSFVSSFCSDAASNMRLLVVLSPPTGGSPTGQEVVRTSVEGELQRGGFEVFDWGVAARQGELGTMAHQLLGARDNPRVAARLGARYLSSYFVTAGVSGSARAVSEEASVYTARAEVRVVRAEDGRVVFSDTYDASGTGINADRARERALSTLAHRVAVDLPDQLREHLPQTQVNLTVKGVPAEKRAEVTSAVQRLKGVTDVMTQQTADGIVIQFRTREKPYAVASQLQSEQGVAIQSVQP